MKILKRFLAAVCFLTIIIMSTFTVSAFPNTDDWASQDLQKTGSSNSDFSHGIVKYEYNYTSKRIHFVFQLEYKSGDFDYSENAGVVININGLGDIKITDEVAEYDENVYFAQINERLVNKKSKSVLMEVTVGLKNGLADSNRISVYVLDLQNVRSNLYEFDIINTVTSAVSDTAKAGNTKTSKTSKAPTEKSVRTTKAKTTKIKTTKTNKSTTQKSVSETLVEQTQEFVPTQSVKIDNKISEKSENNRKVILIFGASAAIIAVISGCIIGTRNKRKK